MSSAQHSRRILIVSYDFPPRAVRGAVRAANLAKFFAQNEWGVDVICCAPDGTVRRDEVWAAQLEQAGVNTHRTKPLKRVEVQANGLIKTTAPRLLSLMHWFKQWSFQPDVYTAWRKEAMPMVEKLLREQSVNIILGVAPPFSDFTLVQEIAEQFEIPFALDYGDVWLDNASLHYPTPMHAKRSSQLEQELLRKTALIISTTRRTKEDLLRRFRFLNHEEIMIVPHGFDAEDFEGIEVERSDRLLIAAYQDFHLDASPKPMFKAVRQLLTQRPELRSQLHINIIGVVRESHRNLLRKWKLQDVISINGLADRTQALNVISNADVLWFCSRYDSAAASAIVGEYHGARKALLLTCPAGHILNNAKEYAPVFHCEATKVRAIIAQLEAVHQAWKNSKLQPSAQQLAKTHSLNYPTNLREVSRLLGMNMKL